MPGLATDGNDKSGEKEDDHMTDDREKDRQFGRDVG